MYPHHLLQPLKALLLLALLATAAGRLVKGKAVSEGKEQGLFYDPVTGSCGAKGETQGPYLYEASLVHCCVVQSVCIARKSYASTSYQLYQYGSEHDRGVLLYQCS